MDRYGLFRLSGAGYAVPLERLLRIEQSDQVIWLPLMPDEMAGMLMSRDQPVPLLASGWLPGAATEVGLDVPYKVLIATEYGPVALPADVTIGIVSPGRGTWVETDPETAYFQPASFCYRGREYPVLNVDMFIVSLARC